VSQEDVRKRTNIQANPSVFGFHDVRVQFLELRDGSQQSARRARALLVRCSCALNTPHGRPSLLVDNSSHFVDARVT